MPRIVFAGCGFLGEAAALLFSRNGWDVIGVTHREESARMLEARGVRSDVADISSAVSVHNLAERVGPVDVIVHAASSGRGGEDAYRSIYREGIANLADSFSQAFIIFTGSTSVYGQVNGEVVDENSMADPGRATGQILLEAEKLALASGGAVARLAGIYGPGRSVLLRKFMDGSARIEGDGSRVINQIHRDDAAAALLVLASIRKSGIFNVVDDSPAPQIEVYRWIAAALSLSLPPTGEPDMNRKRGWTSKRVSNLRIRDLGWTPAYPSYREALPELID